MKMDDKVLEAFQVAVHREQEAAYRYEAMAHWLRHNRLEGMAHWMQMQAKEELEHAERFKAYIEARGHQVRLKALAAPKADFKSVLEVFEDLLKAEEDVSAAILAMRKEIKEVKDKGASLFLAWFITEQESEEADAQRNLDKFALAGITHETKNGSALYLLDKEFGSRA